MRNIFLVSVLNLLALSAFAGTEFYECTLPQAEEFRVGVDVQLGKAAFFDNDSASIMAITGIRPSTSSSANEVLIFKGKDQGGSGDLLLEFNRGTYRIKLSTLETDGSLELLGFAKCAPAQAWDFSQFKN